MARCDMNESLRSLGAFGIGAAAMYLLDPDRGRRRRAILRDKTVSLATRTEVAFGKTARDLGNRTRGIAHEVGSAFRSDPAAEDALVERVRSRIGRVVSHPRAIDVLCSDGVVTLRGIILERELNALLKEVRRANGVVGVRNELDVHATPDVQQLQGGRRRPGNRIDIAQEHWAPATRLLAGTAGAALAVAATRTSGPLGALLALTGGALIARSSTNVEFSRIIGLGESAESHTEPVEPSAATTRREAFTEAQ